MKTRRANALAELRAALAIAKPGEVVVLMSGTYRLNIHG